MLDSAVDLGELAISVNEDGKFVQQNGVVMS